MCVDLRKIVLVRCTLYTYLHTYTYYTGGWQEMIFSPGSACARGGVNTRAHSTHATLSRSFVAHECSNTILKPASSPHQHSSTNICMHIYVSRIFSEDVRSFACKTFAGKKYINIYTYMYTRKSERWVPTMYNNANLYMSVHCCLLPRFFVEGEYLVFFHRKHRQKGKDDLCFRPSSAVVEADLLADSNFKRSQQRYKHQ